MNRTPSLTRFGIVLFIFYILTVSCSSRGETGGKNTQISFNSVHTSVTSAEPFEGRVELEMLINGSSVFSNTGFWIIGNLCFEKIVPVGTNLEADDPLLKPSFYVTDLSTRQVAQLDSLSESEFTRLSVTDLESGKMGYSFEEDHEVLAKGKHRFVWVKDSVFPDNTHYRVYQDTVSSENTFGNRQGRVVRKTVYVQEGPIAYPITASKFLSKDLGGAVMGYDVEVETMDPVHPKITISIFIKCFAGIPKPVRARLNKMAQVAFR